MILLKTRSLHESRKASRPIHEYPDCHDEVNRFKAITGAKDHYKYQATSAVLEANGSSKVGSEAGSRESTAFGVSSFR